MIKIGIITMHRLNNYGSILQAYALQHYIETLGYCCEIIDYQYPNHHHLESLKDKRTKSIIYFLKRLVVLFFQTFIFKDSKEKFDSFRRKWLKVSKRYYYDADSIKDYPPDYDIYITGSDQVWNPRFCCNDDVFMCSFIMDNVPKISYASSMSVKEISQSFSVLLKNYLSSYLVLGVREGHSKRNLEKILDRNVEINCDPTLLVSPAKWLTFVSTATIHIDRPYILFYILSYSYDPYPEICNCIDFMLKRTGLFPVFLNINYKLIFRYKGKYFSSVCPADFISLIKHANIVVTSSFHGVCFSLLMQKQFYALGNIKASVDDERIEYLLTALGLLERMSYKSEDYKIKILEDINYFDIQTKMEYLINESKNYLLKALQVASGQIQRRAK